MRDRNDAPSPTCDRTRRRNHAHGMVERCAPRGRAWDALLHQHNNGGRVAQGRAKARSRTCTGTATTVAIGKRAPRHSSSARGR